MSRLEVAKTYKLYIGGKFPRTESGRTYQLKGPKGENIANLCQASRKDFRESVIPARKAQASWASKTAYNRSQVLYRLAEMMEGRKAQFVDELKQSGFSLLEAKKEVEDSLECLVHYAGWADKYQQIFSSVNPVASSHFNFSVCEPSGVVVATAPLSNPLHGICFLVSVCLAGGNSLIVLASEKTPHVAISFAEVVHTSDVPGGLVNILTGFEDELVEHFASHMDVNAVIYARNNSKVSQKMELASADNMKRYFNWSDLEGKIKYSPYFIRDLQEVKTTWHPIERISSSGSGY